MGLFKDMVPGLVSTVLGTGAQIFGARKQHKRNMELARFQADANQRYLKEMLDYNSPESQMQRFQDAGLNPHLIYGQGNPGNQSASLTYPDIKPTDWQRTAQVMAQTLPQINQTRLIDSQVQAQNAKTIHAYAMVELNRLQQQVIKANPLLDNEGFKAIIDGLKSTASIKASESAIKSTEAEWFTKKKQRSVQEPGGLGFTIEKGTNGAFKMEAELNNLEQRFKLGEADMSIKSEILKSKEFQNAILEIQKNFMTEGDITPQHIMNFIQLLLLRLAR